MPIQPPQWTEFLSCPVCYKKFNDSVELPISLGCGHTVCKACLSKLNQKKCPFDQAPISRSIEELPVNLALLQLAGATIPEQDIISISSISENFKYYDSARRCIGDLAGHLKCLATGIGQLNSFLSRPMQRKLVTLINCQLVEEEGRSRAMRAARSLGERSVTELILQHQNPAQLSTNLWAAIRARGCQFLGPAMQEEVLKLILLALEDGSPLSRKVLVLFVVQRLESQYPQASKTAIGHVVQLLYRASCFKVTKREEESSLMQLKEDFRTYESLRREHDSQVVQIATEAGLRIAPEQWSSLLYGDAAHKSHMQSIIDKLQTPQSFAQSVNELVIALQRTGDLGNLARLCPHLELLANVDPSPDAPPPTWENLEAVLKAVRTVVQGLVDFLHFHSQKKPELPALHSTKYKTSLCRDFAQKNSCPRGANCTFAHSQEELERARGRNKKIGIKPGLLIPPALPSQVSAQEGGELGEVTPSPNIVRPVRGGGTTRSETQDLTVDGEIDSGSSSEPIQTRNVVSTASSLPPMIAPPSVVSSRVGPPMYTGGMPYHSPTGPPRDEYVPANLQTQTVPSVSPYNHHPYMAEGVYYPQHGVSTFPASFTTDVPGQYPGGVGYHTPPPTHNHYSAHRAPHYMGVYEPRFPTQGPYENWPPSMPYYMGPEAQYPHSLPPRYAPTPHMGYPEQPGRESLDDLHHRRKKILVHLNRAPAPLPNPSEQPCRVAPPPAPSSVPQGVGPPGVYRLKSVPMSDSGITLPSLERRPPSSHELAKSVTDTYNASRSLSTLSLSSEETHPRKGMVYTPWSTGESYTPTSDILIDTSTRGSAAYTEKYSETETEEEFDLYKELSDQMRDVNVESPSPVMSTALSSSPSATSIERSIDDCAKSSTYSLDDAYFIPFDPPIVSKYGPISRTSKAKLKSSDPVLVTAKSDSYMVTAVTAVTPTTRPYPVSVQTPSRFAVESVPSQLCPNAEPFTSMVAMPPMSRPKGESNNKSQPYTLWESRDMMYPAPTVGNPTVQDRLKHELAMVEHQIHIRENSSRQLSDKERLQCELQAIEKHISLKTGKPPNASLETSTNHTRRSASSSTRVWPTNKKIVTKPGPVLDPDIDLNAALTPEEEQELNDLHLLVQTSKKDNGCAENQTGTFNSKEMQGL